jgi:phage terminase small subunit
MAGKKQAPNKQTTRKATPARDTAGASTLPDKRALFIEHYLANGFNQTDAAIKAGFSPASARTEAWRLMKNADIRAEIDRRLKEHHITAEEVLARMASHARGDMSDFLNDDGEIDLALARERGVLHRLKSVNRSYDREGRVQLRIELYDAQSALDKLGHATNALKQNVEHRGTVSITELMQGGGDDNR